MRLDNIFVCDFETITSNTKYYETHQRTDIHFGYISNLTYTKKFMFKTIKQMFDWIKDNCDNNIQIYFHNLNFDGQFLLDWMGENGYVGINQMVKLDKKNFNLPQLYKKFKTSNLFRVCRSSSGSRIYFIETLYKSNIAKFDKYKRISFLCSFKKLVSSVGALQKLLNKKGKEVSFVEGFYDIEPKDSLEEYDNKFKQYCIDDVETVIEGIKMFNNGLTHLSHINENDTTYIYKLLNQMTIGSSSYFYLKRNIPPKYGVSPKDLELSLEDREIADKFTNGGMTLINKDFANKMVKNVNLYYIDINSAYPYQMTQPLPFGKQYTNKEEALKRSDKVCEYIVVKCKNIKMRYNIPLIKNFEYKVKENYFLECENYTGYFLKEEWEILLNHFVNVESYEIVERYFLPLSPYFKEQILSLYLARQEAKAKGEEGYIEKILMNAAYGKTSTRIAFDSLLFENDINDDYYQLKDNIYPNEPDKMSYIPNNPQVVGTPTENKHIQNKWIANYICSQTHLKILKGILHFGVDKFVYCDTDSLFLCNIDTNLIVGEYNDSKTLGNWKVEESLHNVDIHFIRAKNYRVMDKNGDTIFHKCAGVNKKALSQDIDYTQKEYIFKKAMLIPKRVKGGIVLEYVDKRIVVEENYNVVVWEEIIEKVLREQKGKRIN